MSLFEVIVNCETGEVSEVPLTTKQVKDRNDYAKKQLIQIDATAQAKAVAEGKLAALGLTTDDLRALGL